jgi:exonuclease III
MIRVYKIAAWNANGLTQHLKEVEVFLNTQKIDTLLVSETHFTERNCVIIPNYIAHDTKYPDRRAHAGTAIIIRKDITHHELTKYETDHIQETNKSIED